MLGLICQTKLHTRTLLFRYVQTYISNTLFECKYINIRMFSEMFECLKIEMADSTITNYLKK